MKPENAVAAGGQDKKLLGKLLDKALSLESNSASEERNATYYNAEITKELSANEKYFTKVKRYEKEYLNEAQKAVAENRKNAAPDSGRRRQNIFYSNTEIILSALLVDLPKPVIKRRFAKEQAKDSKKQFYRLVSDIVQRAIEYNTEDTQQEIEGLKIDYAISGRGVLWCVFDSDSEDLTDSVTGEVIGTKITNEKVRVDFVGYKDFLFGKAKTWKQVPWVARRHRLSMEDVKAQFGDIALEISVDNKDDNTKEQDRIVEVWEIWDKRDKTISFVTDKLKDRFLKSVTDKYKLKDFFPTPEPVRSVKVASSLQPKPEYDLYREESLDLEECAKRIARLIKKIEAKAFYPAKFKDLAIDISNAKDNEFIAVKGAEMAADIGGMDKLFSYTPIEAKQRVVAGLYTQQQNLKENIYEITGISDLMRSVSNPQETAAATYQKGKFGSLRLQRRQAQLNDYINNVYKIITELVCNLFSAETLAEITAISLPTETDKFNYQQTVTQREAQMRNAQANGQQIQLPPLDVRTVKYFSLPTWNDVKKYLEDTKLRGYTFSVETNYSLFEDEALARKARIEIFEWFNKTMKEALPVLTQSPELAEVYLELISFSLDSFRAADSVKNAIEDAFNSLIEKIKTAQQQPQAAKPSPEEIIAEAEMVRANARMKEAEIKAHEVGLDQAKDHQKLTLEQSKAAGKFSQDQQKIDLEKQKFGAQVSGVI